MTERPLIIVAIKVNARGNSVLRNGIASVGVCVGGADNRVIEKRYWNVAPLNSAQKWEASFQRPELPDAPVSATQFAQEFRALLDKWHKDGHVHLISEEAGFDVKFIDGYLDAAGLQSIQSGVEGGLAYYPVQDVDSYVRGAAGYSFNRERAPITDMAEELCIDMNLLEGVSWSHETPGEAATRCYHFYVAFSTRKMDKKPKKKKNKKV